MSGIAFEAAAAFLASHRPDRPGSAGDESVLVPRQVTTSGEWSVLATNVLADLHALGERTQAIPRRRPV